MSAEYKKSVERAINRLKKIETGGSAVEKTDGITPHPLYITGHCTEMTQN